MRKQVLKIVSLSVCLSMAVLANMSINAECNSSDVALINLTNVADANAECAVGIIWNGECNFWGTRCSLTPFPEDQNCDFYESQWH